MSMKNFRVRVLTLAALAAAGLAAASFAATPALAETAAQFEVTLKGDVFTPAEVKVPADKPFTMKFFNKETAAAEIEAKDLKIEKIVAAGGEIIVRVGAMKPGRYLFVNEYKEETVKGYVVVE